MVDKKNKQNYKNFVLHIEEWNSKEIPWGTSDLINLAKKYNTKIPKKELNTQYSKKERD